MEQSTVTAGQYSRKKKFTPQEEAVIRREWATGSFNQQEMIAKHGCSVSTLRRVVRGVLKGSAYLATERLKDAKAAAAIAEIPDVDPDAVQNLSVHDLSDEHFCKLLEETADNFLNQTVAAKISSPEQAATAATTLLKVKRELYPLSMDQAVDWLLKMPDFDPEAFANKLIERYKP